MTLHLLYLGLILLSTLKIQAQDSFPSSTPTPRLRQISEKDFQYHLFQGKWYTMVWAPNIFWAVSQSKAILQSINYTLNDDHSYNVTYNLLRDGKCEQRYDVLLPDDVSGQFYFKTMTFYKGLRKFTFRVLQTDYNNFAIVLLKRIGQYNLYIEHRIYARNKTWTPELKKYYLKLTRSLTLPDHLVSFTEHEVDCSI